MSVSGAIDDLGVRLFRRAVESAGHSIHVTDERGVIEYVNPAFEATTGYSATEAVRKTPRILESVEHDEAFSEELWTTILDGAAGRGRPWARRRSGHVPATKQRFSCG
jgi:PAS domain S-box-containing protein